MRRLVILQGVPGSGKSTFVEREGLLPWTVSSDAVRLLLRGPEQRREGHFGIPTSGDGAAWKTLFKALESRMLAGDLTVIDATHTRLREIDQYRALAERHRYKATVLSWRDLPIDECLRRNGSRPELRRVPEGAIREMHARLLACPNPEWTATGQPEDLWTVLGDPVVDGSPYTRLHVTGDLNGDAAPLSRLLDQGLRDDELYLFTGDYLGDGPDNARIVDQLLTVSARPNVILCEGDTERRIRGERHESATAALLARLVDAVIVQWRGQRLLVSHGGLATMPAPGRLALVPSSQLITGVAPIGPTPRDLTQITGGAVRWLTFEANGRVSAA